MLLSNLTKAKFRQIEGTFGNNYRMVLETTDACGREIGQFCSKDCHPEFCRIVRSSPAGLKRCYQDRLRSLSIATETGQPYICICHAGIVLVCVPVVQHDKMLGGMFFGKCLWEKPSSELAEEINKRLKGIRIDRKKLKTAISKLPVVSGRTVHQAAEFLFVLIYEVAGFDPRIIKWRRQKSVQQSQISELIQERKESIGAHKYPLDRERELINKVKIGDRTGAKEILNIILASIMLADPGDLNVLKARMLELLSILGRSAVEGGVDINFLLERNLDYINKAMRIDNQQDLCAWIGNALNDFIELVYSGQDSRKITQLKPAVEYIEVNFGRAVTLDEVARSAHLSVSRLAHLFKEQMGITVVDYITDIRIKYAKELLLTTNKNCTEICFESGYNNQSYFTRTFKENAKMTPRQFREQNRRTK